MPPRAKDHVAKLVHQAEDPWTWSVCAVDGNDREPVIGDGEGTCFVDRDMREVEDEHFMRFDRGLPCVERLVLVPSPTSLHS